MTIERRATAARCRTRRWPRPGLPYAKALDTRRVRRRRARADAARRRYVVTARAAMATQRHDHRFGDSARARPARHRLRRSRGARRRGRPHVGGGRGDRARRLPIRPTCRGSATRSRRPACSRRTTSRSGHGCRLGQRARRLCTASTARSSARGSRRCCARRVDQPRLGGHGLLRPDAAHRGNRGRGTDAPERADAARGRARTKRLVRSRRERRPVSVHGHAVRFARRRSRSRRPRRRLRLSNLDGADDQSSASNCSARLGSAPFSVTGTYTYVQSRETDDGRQR